MNKIVIDKKKYALISMKEYFALQKKAALKTNPEKAFKIERPVLIVKSLSGNWRRVNNYLA